MITVAKILTRIAEIALAVPIAIIRFLTEWVAFNPRLGPLRYLAAAVLLYVVFAVLLVYVIAPIRGFTGQAYLSERLRYDAERWLATAIYDRDGDFVGTFDPRLDSLQDVNWTSEAIEMGSYVANPDHKSIPVREVPEFYWRCLSYHEDRYIGTILNPFGIDLLGVLKIPYSTVRRSIAERRLSLGVGGSTLPMQFARVIYKTPPRFNESPLEKLSRKFQEWWLAPVIYFELTRGGDDTMLKQWAANHLWLAQRTGGTSLHGVEVASQIVFDKPAKELSIAEQFVLASAVNKPIILLEGSDKLNEVRLDRWRYIAEVRAKTCADRLIEDPETQKAVLFELVGLASGPPDPRVKPKLEAALELHAPQAAARARANPIIRANTLMPSARFGLREEMKQIYGFNWRSHVRGLTASFDAAQNLGFTVAMGTALREIDKAYAGRLDPGFTLDPAKVGTGDLRMPDVVVVAADADGRIVRYFESGQTAPYFGSPFARDSERGFYERARESRMIASTGKILSAIGIANEMTDTPQTLYLDTQAPARGLETCASKGEERRGRQAIVSFACSLNAPLLNRTAKVGQKRIEALIDGFGFNMPPAGPDGEGTPPSTAAVLGQIAGSPRRVHQMSAVVLNALIGRDRVPVRQPTMIDAFDFTRPEEAAGSIYDPGILPARLIRRGGHPLLRTLLESPLCYEANRTSHGTLKALASWCAKRRGDLRLHFAKTGTQVTLDPDATVDAWITGGLQFANGAAYSYVVLVGTGSASQPWARALHSSQVAAPLAAVLLADLAGHAKGHPRPDLLPKPSAPPAPASAAAETAPRGIAGYRPLPEGERRRAFSTD